jgi:hypothetical protein
MLNSTIYFHKIEEKIYKNFGLQDKKRVDWAHPKWKAAHQSSWLLTRGLLHTYRNVDKGTNFLPTKTCLNVYIFYCFTNPPLIIKKCFNIF